MGKSDVVDMLFELLGDPIRLEAIRDDPIIKDVLNKILVMQKLTAKGIFYMKLIYIFFVEFCLRKLRFHEFFCFCFEKTQARGKNWRNYKGTIANLRQLIKMIRMIPV